MILNKEKVKKIFSSSNIGLVDIVIILDKDCNADCPLCVAKHVIKNNDCKGLCHGYKATCKRCCDRYAEDELFYAEVDDILASVHGGNVRITLTGGEPTLSHRLMQTLKILDKYNFGSLNIETNGAGLKDSILVDELSMRNIYVLLSRYATSDSQNNAEFRFKSNPVMEKDVTAFLESYKGKTNMNCILLKNGVSSGVDVLSYYEHYIKLGASDISFTETMFDTTLAMGNKAIAEYYNNNRVSIEKISEELTALGCEKLQDSGDSFRMIVHNHNGNVITLTAADMSRIALEQQNDDNYTKYLIYPSGEIGAHSIENR